MKYRVFCAWNLILALGVMCTLAQANNAPQVSGTYKVLQKTERGAQTQVRLQLHLVNSGQRDLQIVRLTLWDLPHPEKGGTQACSIVLHARHSSDTTQEFTISHSDYETWKRGTKPRLVLDIQTPDGHKATQVVRLEQTSGGKAN